MTRYFISFYFLASKFPFFSPFRKTSRVLTWVWTSACTRLGNRSVYLDVIYYVYRWLSQCGFFAITLISIIDICIYREIVYNYEENTEYFTLRSPQIYGLFNNVLSKLNNQWTECFISFLNYYLHLWNSLAKYPFPDCLFVFPFLLPYFLSLFFVYCICIGNVTSLALIWRKLMVIVWVHVWHVV